MNLTSKLLLGASTALALGMTPILAHFRWNPVRFQQFDYQQLQLNRGALDGAETADYLGSLWSSGWNVLRGSGAPEPDLEDPEAVFDYIFSWLPAEATVFPTEAIYYFTTEIGGEQVRGNIRVADVASRGSISFAYFRTGDRKTWFLDVQDGREVDIEVLDKRNYRITRGDRTVPFKVIAPPPEAPPEESQLASERFICQILDESGTRFYLLFNEETDAYYIVLNEQLPVLEDMVAIDERLCIGQRTGFVYFQDPDLARNLLVGVPFENIKANDFFDGPADQVPYDEYLRDTLYRAYPQTALGEGIDDYGVFLGRDEWCRLAISPFDRYTDLDLLARRLGAVEMDQDLGRRSTELAREFWDTPEWRKWVTEELAKEDKLDPDRGGVHRDLIRDAEVERLRRERAEGNAEGTLGN